MNNRVNSNKPLKQLKQINASVRCHLIFNRELTYLTSRDIFQISMQYVQYYKFLR